METVEWNRREPFSLASGWHCPVASPFGYAFNEFKLGTIFKASPTHKRPDGVGRQIREGMRAAMGHNDSLELVLGSFPRALWTITASG